jgi:hypothetical protein
MTSVLQNFYDVFSYFYPQDQLKMKKNIFVYFHDKPAPSKWFNWWKRNSPIAYLSDVYEPLQKIENLQENAELFLRDKQQVTNVRRTVRNVLFQMQPDTDDIKICIDEDVHKRALNFKFFNKINLAKPDDIANKEYRMISAFLQKRIQSQSTYTSSRDPISFNLCDEMAIFLLYLFTKANGVNVIEFEILMILCGKNALRDYEMISDPNKIYSVLALPEFHDKAESDARFQRFESFFNSNCKQSLEKLDKTGETLLAVLNTLVPRDLSELYLLFLKNRQLYTHTLSQLRMYEFTTSNPGAIVGNEISEENVFKLMISALPGDYPPGESLYLAYAKDDRISFDDIEKMSKDNKAKGGANQDENQNPTIVMAVLTLMSLYGLSKTDAWSRVKQYLMNQSADKRLNILGQSIRQGDQSKSARLGERVKITRQGDQSKSARLGERVKITRQGDQSKSARLGERVKITRQGDQSKSARLGERVKKTRQGDLSKSTRQDERNKSKQ